MNIKNRRPKKFRGFYRSRAGTLLILIGVALVVWPFCSRFYNNFFPPEPVEKELEALLTAEKEDIPFILHDGIDGVDKVSGNDGAGENEAGAIDDKAAENGNSFPEQFVEAKAVLHIKKLDVMTNLTYGVELENLRKIPGIYPQSGYPDTGNVSIAAHRDAWFKDLDKLENGDEIRLYYNGKVYLYNVDAVFITHSRDWSVIDPADKPALTLTTCHPPGLGAAPYRLIARAYLNEVITPVK